MFLELSVEMVTRRVGGRSPLRSRRAVGLRDFRPVFGFGGGRMMVLSCLERPGRMR